MEKIRGEITPELYQIITAIVEERVKEIKVTREDFNELKGIVRELAQAQARTEERVTSLEEAVTRLEEVVEKLAQAQARTEERVTSLEERVTRLEEAVTRLEEAVTRLEEVVEKLAQAQARTEERVTRFERTFETQMGALGARWGLDTEQSFRGGIQAILEDVGFKAKRYLVYDHEGKVFDRPEQVELDVVVQDGKLMLIEIKSSTSRADVAIFRRKVKFYEEREGRKADRQIIISPFVEEKAKSLALALGIEIHTRADDLAEA